MLQTDIEKRPRVQIRRTNESTGARLMIREGVRMREGERMCENVCASSMMAAGSVEWWNGVCTRRKRLNLAQFVD